jgi:hypothetical protein
MSWNTLISRAASQIGDWLYNAALLGYVYAATDSAAWGGAATIARLVPYVLLGVSLVAVLPIAVLLWPAFAALDPAAPVEVVRLEGLAQAADVHVERARVAVVLLPPHFVEQLRPRRHPAGAASRSAGSGGAGGRLLRLTSSSGTTAS